MTSNEGTMLERVADAIFSEASRKPDGTDYYTALALAAVESLLEPSPAMVEAMLAVEVPNLVEWSSEDVEIMRGDVAKAFVAAIQSILQEQKEAGK